MPELQWSQALALDVPAMDRTHQEFIELLVDVTQAGDDRLQGAWDALVEHTDVHFAQEDHWMRQTRFAAGNCHTVQHAMVLQVLRQGQAMGRQGNPLPMRQMAHELAVWFPHHAQTMDAALAAHLQRVGYDPASGEMARPEHLPQADLHGCGSGSCSPAQDDRVSVGAEVVGAEVVGAEEVSAESTA